MPTDMTDWEVLPVRVSWEREIFVSQRAYTGWGVGKTVRGRGDTPWTCDCQRPGKNP